MMTGPILVAAIWTFRPALAFLSPSKSLSRNACFRLLSSSSSTSIIIENNVSRLNTLQTLLSKHGAPGSQECNKPDDLEPVISLQETPELVSSMSGPDELSNLHPYLFPIAKSAWSGNYICAYRNPSVEESDKSYPWPIVETKHGGPGFRLLALNSEHLMRRIACECDVEGNEDAADIIDTYNEGLGQGIINDPSLDSPYEAGSVAKLGYGVDKYVLLRVGPFPHLYQTMALQHKERGDEQSSLIAAEAANSKLLGFGSNFRFYARMLKSFPSREEESRDAARMCLRLPLPTIGLTNDDFKEVAVLGLLAEESDSMAIVMRKLKDMYDKIREAEKDEDPQGKTADQLAIDEATYIIDEAALSGEKWSSVRSKIGEKFRSIGRDDMAKFVDFFNK